MKNEEKVSDFMTKNNIRNVSKSAVNGQMTNFIRSAKPETGLNVSPDFLARVSNPLPQIQNKEMIIKSEKDRFEERSKMEKIKRRKQMMLRIADAIKSIFSMKQNVSTLSIAHVIKYL